MIKCESQLANLQSDYKNKLQAYKSVEDSFARKIETELLPPILQNIFQVVWRIGCYWIKHFALFQNEYNGKLPPRHNVTRLLDEAVRKHKMKITVPQAKEKGIDPKKQILEEEYAINFPRRSTTTT